METGKFDLLGKAINTPPASPAEAQIDTFENKHQSRNYRVTFDSADFTSLCPVTQQSDFATISIEYIPGELCIESKSLKYYLQAYRNQAMFNEQVVNTILTDLSSACEPKWMRVKGEFAARGGIRITALAEYPSPEINDLKSEV